MTMRLYKCYITIMAMILGINDVIVFGSSSTNKYAISFVYHQVKTASRFDIYGICPLLANIHSSRLNFAMRNISVDAVVIVDQDADLSDSKIVLDKMQVNIHRSNAIKSWKSNKNIHCPEGNISWVYNFLPLTAMKLEAACLNYDSIMFSDIDNFVLSVKDNVFSLIQEFTNVLMFAIQTATTPFNGSIFFLKPTASSCKALRSVLHTSFNENGWNNSHYRIPPWKGCTDNEKSKKASKLDCRSGLWNYFGACADQGILLHEYAARLNASDLSGYPLKYIKMAHFHSHQKPWVNWHGKIDMVWWNIWSDLVSSVPEVKSLDCYGKVEDTRSKYQADIKLVS